MANNKNKDNVKENEKASSKVENTIIDNEQDDLNEESVDFENLEVKYEYQSADNAAASGNPAILKIYEINEEEFKFEYNKGFDFENQTIDREIKDIAKINSENKYEYKELENNYTIEIEILEDSVVLKEYANNEFFASINLFLVTEQPIFTDNDVKKALSNYYDLVSAASCDYVLEELTEKGKINYDPSQNYSMNDGTIVTSLQKEDYKVAMLNYISENEYLNNWDIFGENPEGKLTKYEGGNYRT